MPATAPTLALADLEAYDPRAPAGNRERRFCCPLCGDAKPKDAAHRSLAANMESGAWTCYRCYAHGKLMDFWEDRSPDRGRDWRRARVNRALSIQPLQTAPAPGDEAGRAWRKHLANLQAVQGTPGGVYLDRRAIPVGIAHQAGARFSPDWLGRPAVVFPLRNNTSALIAAHGRHMDKREDPKARTVGPKRFGVFSTPGAWDKTAAVIVTEAPIDALSLAAAGFPAIALCGKSGPDWLRLSCGLRRVLLAFDADSAGDGAAAEVAALLEPYGARCERLRPQAKDWNDMLLATGRDALADWLAPRVLIDPVHGAPVATGEDLFDEV